MVGLLVRIDSINVMVPVVSRTIYVIMKENVRSIHSMYIFYKDTRSLFPFLLDKPFDEPSCLAVASVTLDRKIHV